MKNEITQFDELKANVAQFVAPTKNIRVTSFATSDAAIAAGKTIRAYTQQLEKTRKDLVKPLNDQVKLINAYAQSIEAPLLEAEQHIKIELCRFQDEQEKVRLAELKRAEDERIARELEAARERQRIEAEIAAKKDAEIAALNEQVDLHDEAAAMFGADDTGPAIDLDAEAKRIEMEAEQARIDAAIQSDQDLILRENEHAGRQWDINQQRIKNVRKNWKCELVDIAKVPREFLVITLNTQAVLAAARGGVTEIPGVKLWQENSIGFGRNTYVPQMALETEAEKRKQ